MHVVREGKHMGDELNNGPGSPRRADSSYSRFSRSAGISEYRRRRRAGRVFKWVSAIILIAIIGGAGLLFGQRILDMPIFKPSSNGSEAPEKKAEVQEETISTVQPAQISLAMVGDVVLNSSALDSGLKDNGDYDYTPLFSNVSPEVKQHDVRIVAQETNLPGDGYGYGSMRPLNAPQALGQAEVGAGFNVVLRANDHTMDNGTEGLHSELNWWNSEYPKIPVLGVSDPEVEEAVVSNGYASNVYVFEKDGFKVAILNHTWDVSEQDTRYLSALDEQKISADVKRARDAGAQMIVACPHWGQEDDIEPTEDEVKYAQFYANNGVDVIIGTHPRVLQRAEVLQGKDGHKTVCFYSLGCFVSSLSTMNLVGGLAEVTLERDSAGACSVKSAVLKPVVTHRANRGEYTVYLLGKYTEEMGQTGWDYFPPEEATQICTQTLGDRYNAEESVLRVV